LRIGNDAGKRSGINLSERRGHPSPNTMTPQRTANANHECLRGIPFLLVNSAGAATPSGGVPP
jgi:hypothetical protein